MKQAIPGPGPILAWNLAASAMIKLAIGAGLIFFSAIKSREKDPAQSQRRRRGDAKPPAIRWRAARSRSRRPQRPWLQHLLQKPPPMSLCHVCRATPSTRSAATSRRRTARTRVEKTVSNIFRWPERVSAFRCRSPLAPLEPRLSFGESGGACLPGGWCQSHMQHAACSRRARRRQTAGGCCQPTACFCGAGAALANGSGRTPSSFALPDATWSCSQSRPVAIGVTKPPLSRAHLRVPRRARPPPASGPAAIRACRTLVRALCARRDIRFCRFLADMPVGARHCNLMGVCRLLASSLLPADARPGAAGVQIASFLAREELASTKAAAKNPSARGHPLTFLGGGENQALEKNAGENIK